MDCVCVPFRGWMGKTKYLSAFERDMVVGDGRTGLCKNCNAAGFFTLNSYPCASGIVHHLNDIQSTWHNRGKHWSQHWPASLWNTFEHLVESLPDKLRLFWGQKEGVQLNIRKVLMFCTLSVYMATSKEGDKNNSTSTASSPRIIEMISE
jgi:hypothetical protein